MKLNFKNFAFATLALCSLTACNNSDSDGLKKETADVNLTVRALNPATRAIDAPVGDNPEIIVKNLSVRLMDGNRLVKEHFDEAKAGENLAAANHSVKMQEVLVDGTEKVVVVLNSPNKTTNVGIETVQPTTEAGKLANAIYAATESLGGKPQTTYEIKADAKSIVSRLEISHAPKFNKELVKSMELTHVYPINYTKTYGIESIQTDHEGPIGGEVKGSEIKDGSKVVANHLFAGDKTEVVVGFEIEKYNCFTLEDGAYVTIDGSYVYTKEIKSGLSNTTHYYYIKKADKYHEVEGLELVGANVKYSSIDSKASSFEPVVSKDTRYFKLKNFKGTDNKVSEKYEGGKIYKVNLESGLQWNPGAAGDGKTTYDPNTNPGSGTPVIDDGKDPNEGKDKATVNVEVTIQKWTDDNYTVDVQ